MPAAKKLLWLCFLLLAGCATNTDRQQHSVVLSQFMKVAGSQTTPPSERLTAAMKADSVAALDKDTAAMVKCTNIIATLYLNENKMPLARQYFQKMATLADKTTDKESVAMAYNNIGYIMDMRSMYDSAIRYYDAGNNLFRELGDKRRIAQGLINSGIAYKNMAQYDTAFIKTLDAIHILEQLQAPDELASAYSTQGNVLKELGRYADALDYFKKAISIWQTAHDTVGIAAALNNIGNVYRRAGSYDTAAEYYLQSLALKERAGIPKTLTVMNNLATTYIAAKQYDKAETYIRKALRKLDKIPDPDGYMTSLNQLARLNLARNHVQQAEQIALQALDMAQPRQYTKERLDNVLLLKCIYAQKKDYRQMAYYADRALNLKDSVINPDSNVPLLNARQVTEETRNELERSIKRDIRKGAQINRQRFFLILLGIITASLLIAVYLLYRAYVFKKKAQSYVELLIKELNHRVKNNIQIISSILDFQIANAANEREEELITKIRDRIDVMGDLHKQLIREGYSGNMNVQSHFTSIAEKTDQVYSGGACHFEQVLSIHNFSLPVKQIVSLSFLTHELLTNIYKYAGSESNRIQLEIRLTKENKNGVLYIADNGPGWNIQQARNSQSGLGLFLIETLVEQLSGNWSYHRYSSRNEYLITFPIQKFSVYDYKGLIGRGRIAHRKEHTAHSGKK